MDKISNYYHSLKSFFPIFSLSVVLCTVVVVVVVFLVEKKQTTFLIKTLLLRKWLSLVIGKWEKPRIKDLVTRNEVTGVPKHIDRTMCESKDEEEDHKCFVTDYGSHKIRAGASKRSANLDIALEPLCSFPCIIGEPKAYFKEMARRDAEWFGCEEILVGNKALSRRTTLKLNFPIQKYLETGKDLDNTALSNIRTIFTQSLHDVCGKPKKPEFKSAIVATDKKIQESLCFYLFEEEEFESVYFTSQYSLSLFSVGLLNGISLNVGAVRSTVVPIYEGNAVYRMQKHLDIAGVQLDNILGRLISEYQNGINIGNGSTEMDILREIKEKYCYVLKSTPKERLEDYPVRSEKYVLPDKTVLTMTKELYMCPEFLFNPQYDTNIFNIPVDSLHSDCRMGICEMTAEAINKLKSFQERDNLNLSQVVSNVVVHGGCTMLPGFMDRYCTELNDYLYPIQEKVVVHSRNDRSNAPYVGAQMLFQLAPSVFENLAISIAEYEEYGISILNRKFLF
jgi:actin-related protein